MKRCRLTTMQEAMLFEVQTSSHARYVSILHYTVSASVDVQKLRQRTTLLAKRHEALRMSFVRDEDGIIWQEIADHAEIDCPVVSSFDDQAVKIDPFHDPLFKLMLCGEELIVLFHHAMFDGWSISLIMNELLSAEEPASKATPFRYYTKWLERRNYADDLLWWKTYLDGTLTCSPLPNVKKPSGYERHELHFVIKQSEELRRRALELHITAGRFVEAVWCMLMARYHGGDSVVCSVISGRSAPVPGITGMVGMCLNTLPVITRLPKPPESKTFADWVSEWSHETAEAEKHGFCNLGDIIDGPMPHILAIDPSFDGKNHKLKRSSAELVTDFDVTFTLEDKIKGEFAYNSYAYSEEDVKKIQGHFLTALHAILENPAIPLEQIPILTDEETEELTALNIDTNILDQINERTIIDFWQESLKAHANHIALVCGEVSLTYAELSEGVDKLSLALQNRGVGAETPVALILNRSERYVIAELAVMLAGGFFIPLDPEWPDERLHIILDETKPHMVIDEATFETLLADGAQLAGDEPPATGAQMAINENKPVRPITEPKPHDVAYMIMTSGTTGIPKGALIEHRSLANFCLWAKEHYDWRPGDSCALELGFTFDGAMWDIWLPLISGGTLHILQDEIRLDISAIGTYCRINRITHIDLPVTMGDTFHDIYGSEQALPDLRFMIVGGEEVRRAVSTSYRLSNEYGPTECTVCCSVGWIGQDDSPITVGAPPPNMNVYILDEWGRLCPDGVTGEACFAGVQVARGYDNAPDLTAARFVSNPFNRGSMDHKIMYRTGDLMEWGQYGGKRQMIFRGRIDHQIKINGYRVELGEIESVLRSHPAVNAVTVAVREKGEKRICAYVIPDKNIEISELNALIAAKLPSFMRPAILFVDRFPLNSSGKVDYDLLPLPSPGIEGAGVIAPETENEKVLVSVLAELMSIHDIGINYNYLALGGNSIHAMRITYRLEQKGWALKAKDLIASGDLAEAAAKMDRITPVQSEDHQDNDSTFVPLSAQQAMVFLSETEGADFYTVTLRLEVRGIGENELRRRLDKATKLHDILRTTFERDEKGQLIGRVHDTYKIPLHTGDFPIKNGINPLRDPLLELTLNGHELTICYHHIALDGGGVSLLLDELLRDEFPETAPSFATFANRHATNTKRRAEDETWWRSTGRNTGTVALFSPASEGKPAYGRVEVCPPSLLAQCEETARSIQVTTAAFTLAAWGVVLHTYYTGEGDVFIPFVASCRDNESLMGMCAAAHPLKFCMTGETFADLARQTQTAMLESMEHWFVPLDIIGSLPRYLFVFDEAPGEAKTSGDQDYDLVIKFSGAGELIYNETCLSADFVKTIAARLNAALSAALENRISSFCDGEYERVTKTFAQGRKLTVTHQTAAKAFATAADLYAEQIALETESHSLTYAALYEQAAHLSDKLQALGIGQGDIVAFCLARDADGIIAQLGITLSGAAFLPLDPLWPENRTDEIVSDSGAAAVIRCGLVITLTGAKGKLPSGSAYVIYTSGTTGKPKGVILPQCALANQIAWTIEEFDLSPEDKMLHYIAFTFDPSVWIVFSTLSSGATLSLLPEHQRLDPDAVARYICKWHMTTCVLPAAVGPDILRRVKASDLRTVFFGGEPIRNLPPGTGGIEKINCYGPTETCVNATFYRLADHETDTANIGGPVANTACYVLNKRGNPCPVGVRGELCIGGVQVATGYLNRPDESAAAFVEHPVFGRIYHTGDQVSWHADGSLRFYGRMDRQVKIRGNRVELSEIEHAINELPGILDAKVKLVDEVPHAYVICREGQAEPKITVLRQQLSKCLPSYMLPRTVTKLFSFPLTQNGKTDYEALPAPEVKVTASKRGGLSKIENTIASAWRTALGVGPDFGIEPGDNFYDLGGHSLLLFHVVGLLATSGVTLDIKTLIGHPVLADLAKAAEGQKHIASPQKPEETADKADRYRRYVQKMEQIDLRQKRSLDHILITGATGFLGSYLVREFFINTDAVIHLPTRGGIKGLQDSFVYYFGEQGTQMIASKRIRVYQTDISAQSMDLRERIDAIFHAAADIRHYAPEQEMYRANVTATENMLALAGEHPGVLFAHISTTSAVNTRTICENDSDLGPAFDNIYQRTKQLAEKRVFDAGKNGLAYSIFRIGHVSPGLDSGHIARNWRINAMLRLMSAMIITELLPERDDKIAYGYADKVARVIRLLAEPTGLSDRVFHIDNPHAMRLSALFQLAGLTANILPQEKLTERLRLLSLSDDEVVRKAASEYLGRLSQGHIEKAGADVVAGRLCMEATLVLLKRTGFEWPHVTEAYMKNMISNLKREGGMP